MAPNLQPYTLDNGLIVIETMATDIYLCSAEPTTYTAATVTFALANKTLGAGNVCGAPVNGSPNGREVTTTAVTGGNITASGTATNWAIVDTANSRLLAVGLLSPSIALVSGNQFVLPAFNIQLPNQ